MNALDAILSRRSCRKFTDKPIETEGRNVQHILRQQVDRALFHGIGFFAAAQISVVKLAFFISVD